MDFALEITLLLLGFTGAFFSGLLGIGGAIVMIPLLLYVPALLGLSPLDMRAAAGLSMVQVLFATLSGLAVHHRNEFVNKDLVICMGGGGLVGSLAGGVASKYVSSEVLAGAFAILALAGAVLMLLPQPDTRAGGDADGSRFNRALAFLAALSVGVMGGMVGAGGAFILIPFMLYVLAIPIRIAIGSSLGIVFLMALAGLAGKIGTGQIAYPLAVALVIGALPGAYFGSRLSKRVDTGMLKLLLAATITISAIEMWYGLLAEEHELGVWVASLWS